MFKMSKVEEMGLMIGCMVAEADELNSSMVFENIDNGEVVIVGAEEIAWNRIVLSVVDKKICVSSVDEIDEDTLLINDMYELKFM